MANDKPTSIGWRLLWGVIGAGIAATLLSVSGLGLTPPLLIAASIGAGIVAALVGPLALELLNFV